MIDTKFELSICLKIETDEDIDMISNVLNLSPTDSIKKGTRKSKVLDKAESNIWMYDVKYGTCNDIGKSLHEYLESIPQLFCKTEELKKIGTIAIRLSIVSDFAQIGISLSEEEVALLNRLQIPIEMSILSWGQCVDE